MSRPRTSPGLTSDSFIPLSRQNSGLHRTTTARPTTTATSVATQDIICAVSESRGISSTVGLAFVNLSTAETVLCQICDSQTYVRTVTKIGVFEPTEILFMNTAKESKLFYIIEENIPNTTFTFLDRKSWSDKTGLEYADRLAFPIDIESIKITFGGNYFAACCFAAVIQYVELELNRTFMAHSLRIRFEPSQGSMSIDLPTIFSLELIQNLHVRKSKESLYGLLNETLTPMGARVLRANVLQPSTEESKLLARYDAVEDLSTKEEMFASIRQALKGFVDADKVLTSLILVPTKQTFQYLQQCVNNVIMLKTYLCAPVEYRDIEQMIEDTINDHITYQTKPLDLRNQRIYCIKAGVNTLLDVARQTYKEASIDAAELVAQLSETHSVDLDLKFDKTRQYYMSFQATELDSLPEIFINVYRKKNRIECQTLGLVKLNQKILDAHNEVVNMSDETIQDLIKDVCAGISKLFRASEAIAMLDMLAAFAHLASCNDYIRPELTDTLAIKDGRHPIREKIHAKKFIPNDAYVTQQSRFQIITGCNMSGKSTYIRTLALMTVMSQVGCFIPAEYASFRIVHELFARVSTSDDLEANVSTFAAEMREMSFILRNISPRSMVIVDELGRGTNTTDGLCIAIAIAEALIQSNALVWFATHFQDLATILAERSGVISLHLAAEISPDASKMRMLYKIAEGPNMSQFYGLALAKLVDLSPIVLQTAQRVSEQLNEISDRRQGRSRALAVARKRNLLLSLREQLLQARNGNLKGDVLRKWLRKLQDEFALRMAAVDEEHDLLVTESSSFDVEEDGDDSSPPDYCDEEELETAPFNSSQSFMLGSPFEYSDDGLPSDSVQVFNDESTDEMLTFGTSSSDGQMFGVGVSSDVFS
ncbi:MutS family protein MSH4 [Aspergillus affinis]|uniref:MutS family protein MSH4 n=1 Tax=Aspergillus affinis TaxID=1070780 RepID=UPI0022FF11BF|nr:putative DNA mismatch repair protein Msh4 [Aspergillus affinis]KAI9038336.1 putative DNA mismatch repair protein Msh4 [Aspergillus affinis]